MPAVDSNVLVRLLTRDEPAQLASAEEFVAKSAWVSNVVLAETIWVLASVYELDARQIATAVEMLLQHDRLSIEDPDAVYRAVCAFRRRPAVDFTDYLILEIARENGHFPIGTFDRELAKVEGAERL